MEFIARLKEALLESMQEVVKNAPEEGAMGLSEMEVALIESRT
jgi:N-acyl-D-aspartate/D-glutamate deacylase